MHKYNVVIVGSGNIGAFYDDPSSENILTHAHAFKKHSGFNLLGFVDINIDKARRAAEVWGTNYYSSIEEVFAIHDIDVVCIAVPDLYHFEYLQKIALLKPRIVFAEKPLVQNFEQAKKILELYNKDNMSIQVNYSRRFVPEFIELAQKIRDNYYGEFVTGVGYYGKGFLHNGSHMLDLLKFFFDDIKLYSVHKKSTDFYANDPCVAATLLINKGIYSLNYIPCNLYEIFELDLLFNNARLRIVNEGYKIIEYYKKSNTIFSDYTNLVKNKEVHTRLSRAMYFAADNIWRYLSERDVLLSPINGSVELFKEFYL